MPRNVEIKASVANFDNLSKLVCSICGEAEVLVQADTFFRTMNGGRLKLREFRQPRQKAELIFYEREDVAGAKLSDYVKVGVEDSEAMKLTLSRAHGILGTVQKTRQLFTHNGQTRVHLDRVDGLGDFLEFEVCLKDDQTLAEGQQIADDLLKLLNIPKANLVSGAYFDHLLRK